MYLDRGFQFSWRHVFNHARVADADRQNESADSADIFLVGACCRNELCSAQFERRQRAIEMNQLSSRAACAPVMVPRR